MAERCGRNCWRSREKCLVAWCLVVWLWSENLMGRQLFTLAVVVLLNAPSIVLATDPSIGRVLPPGGQRGTDVDLVLEGSRLEDAAEIMWYEPGIAVNKIEFRDGKVQAKVHIADDCRLGGHALRLRTPTGLSELRTFYVGTLPTVAEAEPNNDVAKAQKIGLNVTATGIIENEDVDYFVVEAEAAQRIIVVVEGVRLGRTLFDPYIVI